MLLALHPATSEYITHYADHPSHALLLTGPSGSGKGALAQLIVSTILDVSFDKVPTHPSVLSVQTQKESIGIEAIHRLHQFLRLKSTGTQVIRRAIIIEDADTMTIEAQNALLKILEEPPMDTILLLTASQPRALLPTIRSRLQTFMLRTPSLETLTTYFKNRTTSDKDFQRAYRLSGGMPGLLHALLQEDKSHPLFHALDQAKKILSLSSFERVALVDALAKQKQETKVVLDALQRICQAGLATNQHSPAKQKKWHTISKAILETQAAVERNANTKLALTVCFLSW